MTGEMLLEQQLIRQLTLTCSHKHFGWSKAESLRSHATVADHRELLEWKILQFKITSYGNFRNGKVWSSNRCLGSCTVQYGGQYKTTDAFQQAECSSNIQSSNKIGFWCDWDCGDGSGMMIGGGGSGCNRADHGIEITETNAASFVELGGV